MLAIEQSRAEVIRISESCHKMMAWLKEVLISDEADPALIEKTAHEEQVIDQMQDEVVSFMTSLLASNIPEDLIGEARRQLRMADEYESISDYIGRILKYHVKMHQAGLRYEEPERDRLLKLHDMVDDHLAAVSQSYRREPRQSGDLSIQRGRNIAKEVRDMRREIIDRMGESGMPPRISVTYNRQLIAYRRVRDHTLNIAEAIAGLK
jgi:phosphate:Na+ symporter